jgi:hypothetical protein
MPVGRNCFSGARRFAKVEPPRSIVPDGGAVVIDAEAGVASDSQLDPAAASWTQCCLWVQRTRADKRFLISDVNSPASAAKSAAAISDAAKALSLALGGSQRDMGATLVMLLSRSALMTSLNTYAAQGGRFVILTLQRSGWAHAIAVKLNRSATRLDPRAGYLCAIFDPTIGQAVYNDHDALAADLLTLLQSYGMVSSVSAQLVCDSSQV